VNKLAINQFKSVAEAARADAENARRDHARYEAQLQSQALELAKLGVSVKQVKQAQKGRSLSNRDIQDISRTLEPFRGTGVQILRQVSDRESENIAGQLSEAFSKAGIGVQQGETVGGTPFPGIVIAGGEFSLQNPLLQTILSLLHSHGLTARIDTDARTGSAYRPIIYIGTPTN